METTVDPIRQHATAFARAALIGSVDHQGRVHEHLDDELARYHSMAKRHAFLTDALEELDLQFHAHVVKEHANDPKAACGQRPRHAQARVMAEDRRQAIEEQRDPLFGRRN